MKMMWAVMKFQHAVFDVQADIENYASGEESDEGSTCDGDCNEDSAINEQIDNGSTGDINTCNRGQW